MFNKALKKAKENKKGFTLAELLIVVAIIAVLVAISIPIFTSQLEKSREAVDAANIRSAYAEVMTAAVTGDSTNYTKEVTLKQKVADWQNAFDFPADLTAGTTAVSGNGTQTATITYAAPAAGTDGAGSVSIDIVLNRPTA